MTMAHDPRAPTFCRACLQTWRTGLDRTGTDADPCPACSLPTLRTHPELFDLDIAHIDCDAFYASVEKRDNPDLRDKPVLVGGLSNRAVVTTACYVARKFGPRSAMPMWKARELCPHAVVIKPDMAKYRAVGQQIRDLMLEVTPVIEPLSLDEAYLDLTADTRLDVTRPPAVQLAALAKRVRAEVGISISIGLAPNKFLAKLASDLDKPRGFAVIGAAEAEAALAPMKVSKIHGIGPQTAKKLEAGGVTHIHQLQAMADEELRQRFGKFGDRLSLYIRGQDPRRVTTDRVAKSVSAETTFHDNMARADDLVTAVAPLCDRVAQRLADKGVAGQTVVLKLKTADFQSLTRNRRLATPTNDVGVLLSCAEQLIRREADGRSFRLIGIGLADLTEATSTNAQPDLFGG
ncbi:MAG: DNA polymerase IV, partial [Pseudomonadota bacterium]